MNCFNGQKYLREALDSVMAQTFADWELIFWDNASTDDSGRIAKSYQDDRLRYFRAERNAPLGAARKLAMEQARGEWVGFLDTDDLWKPEKLARQLELLDGTRHVLCYAGVYEIDCNGRLIRTLLPAYTTGEMFDSQLRHFDINMVTPLVRRQVLIDNGVTFDPSVTASEEYNLFMRLLTLGTACSIPEVLGSVRIAPGTLTERSIGKWADERFYTIEQLVRANPSLMPRHQAAFAQAMARGHYYRARWHMAKGEFSSARESLRQAASAGFSYRMLGWLALWPTAWRLAHAERFKRQMSTILKMTR